MKDPSNYPTQPHQSDEEFATLLQSQEMEQFDDPISLDEYTKKKHVTWSTVPAKSKQKKSFQSSATPTDLEKDFHTENTGPLKGITLSNDYEERKETWSLQRQTSYGKLKENESFSCYMLLMLSKGKNEYKPFTAQKHLNHFRSLMAVLQSSDPTLSLLPLDELAEDQSEIHTIPTELKSIWNKLLYRHISSKHCTFGNRTSHQSFDKILLQQLVTGLVNVRVYLIFNSLILLLLLFIVVRKRMFLKRQIRSTEYLSRLTPLL